MSREASSKTRLLLSISKLTDLGWATFQTKSDKSPATKRGYKDAKVDCEQVLSWRPDSMAGHATGLPPEIAQTGGRVVIDLDIDLTKNVNGLDWLLKMERVHGALAPHPIAMTPRGGEHHYFKHPEDRVIRNSAGKIGPGVDVRGTGGYVIVPNSASPAGEYSWKVPPWDVTEPDMPSWLLDLVAEPVATELEVGEVASPSPADLKIIENECARQIERLQRSKPGSRNQTLNTVAFYLGKIVGAGALDENLVQQRLFEVATQIGLAAHEIKATVRSGLNAGRRHPWHPQALNQSLHEINRDYFFSVEGKTALVFFETRDPLTGNRTLARLYPTAFKDKLANRFGIRNMPDGSQKNATLGQAWLSSPNRRQYERVVFAPGRELSENVYNQWQGFAVDSVEGDYSTFSNFMFQVLCNNNREHFRYLIHWCARAVQYPGTAGEVAVVFRGSKGTGKTFFAHHLGEIFGDHFVELVNARHLTGNFNAHLELAVLVFADEAFWAGDVQGESTLKSLITSDRMLVERKGIDPFSAPNCVHLIMASNSDWVVPASGDERRFFVLNVSEERKQDHAYFEQIERMWQSGEREAFLHYLLQLDLSTFNVRSVPQTEALLEQKTMSLPAVDRWYFQILQSGTWAGGDWPTWESTSLLYSSFTEYCSECRTRIPTLEAFGMRMARLLPPRVGSQNARIQRMDGGRRVWGYEIAPLDACRRHFELAMGYPIEWETIGEISSAPDGKF